MSLVYCQDAEELLGAYGLVVHELVCLHQEQFESVKRNTHTSTIWRLTAAQRLPRMPLVPERASTRRTGVSGICQQPNQEYDTRLFSR